MGSGAANATSALTGQAPWPYLYKTIAAAVFTGASIGDVEMKSVLRSS